ncbi:MAG: hypothetical protein ACRDFC_04145 [Ignavibacteria bacterium]
MKNKIVTIFKSKYPGGDAEAFVMTCEHHNFDETIYICNEPKHWKKVSRKQDWVDIMTCIVSHETLHFVITKTSGDVASLLLDNLFSDGELYKEDYHGLCLLRYRMRDYA